MKKIFLCCVALLFAGEVFADGSWTRTGFTAVKDKIVIELTWVADASAHTVPDYTLSSDDLLEYYLYRVVTDPGATAPTALYDITINDSYGDVTAGGLSNRSASATEILETVVPYNEDWTISLSGNSVNSATGIVQLTFVK
jgi:hypothetical protein